MPNIREIAARCGLSVSTVSKALNNYSDVSPSTRERVLKMAGECGYFPNSLARGLKTNRTHNLGVLFADEAQSGLRQEYFAAVLDAFKAEAEKRSYDITFINHNMSIGNYPMTYLEHCRYRKTDGVCIACIDFEQPEVRELVESSLPVVTVDREFPGRSSVNSANAAGMRELTRYVLSKGHRKVAYVHGQKSSVTEQRMLGFRRAMRDGGLEVSPEYLAEAAYHDPRATRECVVELLKLPERPTCIILPDDYAAFGGIEAMEAAGMRIPEDVSVAGYDGIPLLQRMKPRLTTLRQETETMGREAARRLIEQVESPGSPAESITVKGTLIPGQSVAEPGSAEG